MQARYVRGWHWRRRGNLNPDQGEEKLLHALELGLAKVMSKMGISVVDSYRGAHLFDALGLSHAIVDKCFAGTPAPIGGLGFDGVEAYVRRLSRDDATPDEHRNMLAKTEGVSRDLPDYGFIRFRKADEAESHAWQPQTVRALQTVVGSTSRVRRWRWHRSQASAEQVIEAEPATLRDLLEIRPAGPEIATDSGEEAASIAHRFVASAM